MTPKKKQTKKYDFFGNRIKTDYHKPYDKKTSDNGGKSDGLFFNHSNFPPSLFCIVIAVAILIFIVVFLPTILVEQFDMGSGNEEDNHEMYTVSLFVDNDLYFRLNCSKKFILDNDLGYVDNKNIIRPNPSIDVWNVFISEYGYDYVEKGSVEIIRVDES